MISNRGSCTYIMSSFVLLILALSSSLFGVAEASSCIERLEYYEMCDDLQRCRPMNGEVCTTPIILNTANNTGDSSTRYDSSNNNNNRVFCINIKMLDKNHHVQVEHVTYSSEARILHNAVNIRRFAGREWTNHHVFNSTTLRVT